MSSSAATTATRFDPDAAPGAPLVEIRGLTKLYKIETGFVKKQSAWLSAVEDFNATIARGETLGLVGESGSGKSTIARLLLRLVEPTRGQVLYEGHDVFELGRSDMRRLRRKMQIVFQDPFSSLNPRHTVAQIVGEGIADLDRRSRRARVDELLDIVGLSRRLAERYPHEFSGGQRQRIGIARALAVEPEFLILDEPVSALDVSVQSKILNLLRHLKESFNLTYLFISHDLSVVRHIADRVAVLYLGHLMELAPKEELFANPRHPYTQALLSAVPTVGGDTDDARIPLTGEIPSSVDIQPRC
ncbi:MAG: ABC transporter ATP-binding protein, partial [Gaiellaceae bacterium]